MPRNEVMMLHPPHFCKSHLVQGQLRCDFPGGCLRRESQRVGGRLIGHNGAHWCAKKMGNRTEKVRCDSFTNSLWQDPGSHKGCTVPLYLYHNEQIRAVRYCCNLCVFVCVHAEMHLMPFIIKWSVSGDACTVLLQPDSQSAPGSRTATNSHCWGRPDSDYRTAVCVGVFGRA